MSNFTYQGKNFMLDGKPFQVRSGAIHYFRVPSCYWYDRLLKLKECGFNTVETYVAWNVHEKNEGNFDFHGEKNLAGFLDTAKALGLYAIVRPGPFICAEWEMGGFPAWLLKYRDLKLRCDNPLYFEKLKRYLAEIAKILVPRLYKNGGNILMLQVENEYGSFGNDKTYLSRLRDEYLKIGLDCLLITADGAEKWALDAGQIKEVLPTATFGSKTEQRMELLQEFIGDRPAMCTEFWDGWFDHWYDEHHVRSVESICVDFEPFLKNGYSFNFYMFHGGTNFGFMNGANYTNQKYAPTVTSYDYNALVSEAGDRTEAYFAVRDLIAKYTGIAEPLTAKESQKRSYGKVRFTATADLFENLNNIGQTSRHVTPTFMEDCGQNYGYILYSSSLPRFWKNVDLNLTDMADRAQIFIDGEKIATLERGKPFEEVRIDTNGEYKKIDILVENMGRINYGAYVADRKGLSSVKLWEQQIFHWDITTLPMENFSALQYKMVSNILTDKPSFYKGTVFVDEVADTFIKPLGFSKGFILINGFNVGRYYNAAGPQKTLYVPKFWLHKGENEIIIFDSDGAQSLETEFVDVPEL